MKEGRKKSPLTKGDLEGLKETDFNVFVEL